LKLVVSKGPNRVGASFPILEDGKKSSFGNVVFSSYLEFHTKHKVQKPIDPEFESSLASPYALNCFFTELGSELFVPLSA
jgi:hypothetical protein